MKIDNKNIDHLEISEETCFSWAGCDNCDNGLGASVYECKAIIYNPKDHYYINLCSDCIMSYSYGNELDKECKNKFKI
jgi:hypothetical protein